jgi:hypothetical protein
VFGEHYEVIRGNIERVLRAGVERGAFRSVDVEDTSQLITDLIHGARAKGLRSTTTTPPNRQSDSSRRSSIRRSHPRTPRDALRPAPDEPSEAGFSRLDTASYRLHRSVTDSSVSRPDAPYRRSYRARTGGAAPSRSSENQNLCTSCIRSIRGANLLSQSSQSDLMKPREP